MNKIILVNELTYNGNAHIITTHKGKSHNELGSKSIIIAKISQDRMHNKKICSSE
jgi:hypothetical protein